MKTLLVVDDFTSVRLYHQYFLSHQGYRCLEACDGAEALQVLREDRVDLMLLDLVMPALDGPTLIATLRSMPAFRSLPILAITSEALTEETRQLTAKHGVDTLLKPVLPAQLLSKVQELLGG